MPKPTKTDRTRSQYVGRFMANAAMRVKYPKAAQRLAVAYSEWRKHKKG